MANKYKYQTGVALGTNTNWSLTNATTVNAPAAAPGAGDTAYWQSGSLGASLTGNISPDAIQIDGAIGSSITHSSGTITVGTGGITLASGTTTTFTTAGTLATNGNQNWVLYGLASANTFTVSTFSGSGTVTISNPAGTVSGGSGLSVYNPILAPTSNSTATLILSDNTAFGFAATSGNALGTGATVRMVGTNTLLFPGTSGTCVLSSAVSVENDATIGVSGRTLSISGNVSLGGTTRIITFLGTNTISGSITGTAGFTKAGAGTLTLLNVTPANNTLTGTVTISAGDMTWGNGTYATPNSSSTVNVGQLPNASVSIGSGRNLTLAGSTGTITLNGDYSGDGYFQAWGPTSWVSPGVVFTGSIANLGPSTPAVNTGLYFNNNQNNPKGYVTAKDLPRSVTYFYGVGGATSAFVQSLELASTAVGATYPTKIFVQTTTGTTVTSVTYAMRLQANQANGNGGVILQGGIDRVDSPANGIALNFTLDGTNTDANEVSGTIKTTTGGTLGIIKSGVGKWILSGTNTYTGPTSISAGTLSARSNSAFGGTSAGDVTQTGGTIEVTGGITLDKTGRAFTLISAASANALTSTSGSNTITCAGVTLSSTIKVDIASGASLTMNNSGAMTGAFGITKNNSGEFNLGTFANTFTGAVTVAAGTLTVGNLANAGSTSAIGTGSLASGIDLTDTLKYTGAGHSTNRQINFLGSAPVLNASGTGAVTFSACSQGASTRTIIFAGTNTDANTLSANLANGATGTVSVSKSGAGKWVLSGATLSYTGTTTVSAGTLNLGSANRTLSGAVSVSGGTLENSTSTIQAPSVTMTGGTVTADITSTTTLTVNSGSAASLNPTNNANTFSGATTVASGGILQLYTGVSPESAATGRVLGTSAVTVTGSIKTGNPTGTQKGQMRYGGNLTFNSGAALYIGSAA